MHDVILGGVVCACCLVLAYWLRLRYKKRTAIYADWLALVSGAQESIRYALVPLPKVLQDFGTRHPGELWQAVQSYPSLPEKGPQGLQPTEWQAIKEELQTLGLSDAAGQNDRLTPMVQEARQRLDTARQEEKSKGALYGKLCVLAGLAAWLMMI